MGYIEETGAAQYFRDARILTIYEGTTGIQALDFIGRKTLANDGAVLKGLLLEIEKTQAALLEERIFTPQLSTDFRAAIDKGSESLQWVLSQSKADRDLAAAVAYHFLMQFGYLIGGWLMLRSALCAKERMTGGQGDQAFNQAKIHSAQFYFEQLLPRSQIHGSVLQSGNDTIINWPENEF
jgi:hypothetical protein